MDDKNNLHDEKSNNILILNIKNFVKVFSNRKWWFVVTVIIALLLSLLFSSSFYKNSHYGVKSRITVSLNYNDYNTIIYSLFPDESAALWLNLTEDNIPSYLEGYIVKGISNELFISELNKSLNFDMDVNELWELISFNVDDKKNELIITTYYDDPETAMKINEAITHIYTSNMIDYFNDTYNVLLSKIEKKISVAKLNDAAEEYSTLISLQKYLTENKDIYINRIFVENLPDIERNSFGLREVFVSLCVSIFAGIIAIYIVDFIYVNKKKKNL